ncbi:MAG: histidine triad nucleotide-binding protein [Holophaga sp.]|nr:histidine triad nucleotide-binding protein [Holophaga sp.]
MSDPNCLFCKIAAKQIPATIVYEDAEVVAFKDIAPQVPVHLVLVPKAHCAGLNDLSPELAPVVGRIALVAKNLAGQMGIAASGYRLVANCGADAGQTVQHLHFHLLGGAPMGGRMA